MSKLVITMFLSLDGVMEEPTWTMPYWNDQIAAFKLNELRATDAHLLGRITYQGFAAAWPSRTDEQGFAERMNGLPKYVVSTTLQNAEWNNSTIIHDHIPEEVAALKEQHNSDILVAGSGQLVKALMRHNLVDEFRLLVYPVVLGKGKRLFQEGSMAKLNLIENRAIGSGVVLLRYEPAREEQAS
jgi:dihydrofolate reductase